MKELLCVRKDESSRAVPTDDIIKVFENSNDLNLMKSLVEKAQERIFLSWASVEVKDKSGELIPVEDLAKQQKVFIEERDAPIMFEHTNKPIGKTLAFKILEHPKSKTNGILHLNKVHNHNKSDDIAWRDITSGKLKGLSVGGMASTTHSFQRDESGEGFVSVINDFEHFETSAVSNPCNPLALNEAFSLVAKSDKSASIRAKENETSKRMEKQEKQEENIQKASLDEVMAKIAEGEALSDEEINLLSAAIDASKPEEEEKEEPQEDADEEENKEEDPDRVSELEDVVESLIAKVDELSEAVSGKPEDEEKEEDEEPEDEEEKSEESQEESKTEEKKEESQNDLSKSLEEKTKEVEELKEKLKKFENVKVVKSERPKAEVNKSRLTAVDVALGRAKYDKATGEIVARGGQNK